jgi:DNA-binding NtrC family response regulator
MNDAFNWRILLIDDEKDILDVVSMTLSDAGFTVRTAEDGLLGLEACQDFQPHIAITDIRMPRMNGIELLEHIKTEHPEVEVIVVTAFAEMDQAIKALQKDYTRYLEKGWDETAKELMDTSPTSANSSTAAWTASWGATPMSG